MRILCPDPTRLTSLLDAIADQKNCTLQRVAWDFGATNERRAEWLALCAQRARAKAAAIATALGHELGGVERIVEERTPEAELRIQTFGDVLPAMARRSASVSEELGGLELSPTTHFPTRAAAKPRSTSRTAPSAAGRFSSRPRWTSPREISTWRHRTRCDVTGRRAPRAARRARETRWTGRLADDRQIRRNFRRKNLRQKLDARKGSRQNSSLLAARLAGFDRTLA
jgi:hypothetical protein